MSNRAGVENVGERDFAARADHLAGDRVQVPKNLLKGGEFGPADQVGLVDDEHVGKLDLVDEQVGERALVLLAQR